MQTVNIAELKTNLSYYIRLMQSGQEIMIRDRQRVIGKLAPLNISGEGHEAHLLKLSDEGKIKLGSGVVGQDFWKMPRPRIKGKSLQEIIDEEREE